ncbi:MAG: hypothetical protein NC489_17140 [Ruminococcus flavefaciens]|nr:hypothetical protein [Ruminococcus flavefaciens]
MLCRFRHGALDTEQKLDKLWRPRRICGYILPSNVMEPMHKNVNIVYFYYISLLGYLSSIRAFEPREINFDWLVWLCILKCHFRRAGDEGRI